MLEMVSTPPAFLSHRFKLETDKHQEYLSKIPIKRTTKAHKDMSESSTKAYKQTKDSELLQSSGMQRNKGVI